MSVANWLFGAVLISMGAGTVAADAVESPSAKAWQSLLEQDLQYLEAAIPKHYIYAVYPGGEQWQTLFQRSLTQARREAAQVKDFGSYRAVLQHFIVSFEDAHLSAYFNVNTRRANWPRFKVEYQGGRYVVTSSQLPTVKAGDAVTTCDGRAMHEWTDGLAEFYGGPRGLETTRAAIARQMFLDFGNPLYSLPTKCRIGENEIALTWGPAPEGSSIEQPQRTSSSAPSINDSTSSISEFGDNVAWVRMGTMMPATAEAAAQFRQIIDGAPGLRDRDAVILDVRGNPGGTYNWFMAFLRGFYGQQYADYMARARLEISNVMLVISPTGADDPGFSADQNRIEMPPDPPMTATADKPKVRMLPNGTRLVTTRPAVERLSFPKRPPANPVRAKVYVLTDYGCASACLSFMDEIMRFPGVTQIGGETHIDRRSGGWPEAFELPSGLAVVRMGRLVREGRRRGENEAWKPSRYFEGNIADTDAVKHWIREQVLPQAR
ncbi:S41 family peptidase [Steroidobacter flavus]|uniref:S41 family peptidase n=1 Tax=Steroidobacter flavus TaxID=1842136 RepID=A0ABV8SKA0_9GAMM